MIERTNHTALTRENAELRQQLQEAEELIAAIRTGAVDALAVRGPDGPRIYTLEGADQSYRTLIEQMNEGALLLSDDATVLYCNACLAGLLGAPLEALIGACFTDFVPTEFRPYWQELMATGWAGKGKGEMPLHTQGGRLWPCALALNKLFFHDTPVLAVIVADVSAQREINAIRARVVEQNELLERKNEELRTQDQARQMVERAAAETSRILEGIPQIAWTADSQGRNTYFNRRWFDYTGQDTDANISQLFSVLIHPDDLPGAEASWRQCIGRGEALEVECRILGADGQYRWMLGRALPSRNQQGEVIQWIGTYTDIHEHKLAQQRIDQAQHQLRHNNEELRRTNHDLDNFIYTASHDLKQPINNIEGLLQALRGELPLDLGNGEAVLPLLGMMQDSVDRFKRTIEHLTEVTKLQKEHEQSAELQDLSAVIRDITLDMAPLMQATGVQLEVEVDSCPFVSFSAKNLHSVIYNLLSNAVKYHAPERPPRVRVRCRAEGEFVVLSVQDNGLGLQVTGNQKLFNMFQRFHDHVEGSGIGLYMVKRIMENAGGRIEVESEVGVGSVFSVYFPR